MGEIYDPDVRQMALKNLIHIYKRHSQMSPRSMVELEQYSSMLKMFKNTQSKHVIFWIDALNDRDFESK